MPYSFFSLIISMYFTSTRWTAGIGCVLCLVCLRRYEKIQFDFYIMIPMLAYVALGTLSSYAATGTAMKSSMETLSRLIYPAIYLAMAFLKKREVILLRRLCVLLTAAVALHGLFTYVLDILTESAKTGRMSGILKSPNALGIFLALGWFALNTALPDDSEFSGKRERLLRRAEPILLTAMSLTLSMGSFLSFAAGLLVTFFMEKKKHGWRTAFSSISCIISKSALCFALAILIYISARRTNFPWLCVPLLVYLIVLSFFWLKMDNFIKTFNFFAIFGISLGLTVAVITILIRSNATDTFTERLMMMRNGLTYVLKNPILGVGPNQWRLLNETDSDIYFNVPHIHNIIIHSGAEYGLAAMFVPIVIIVRRFKKGGENTAGFAAFIFHNMIDTSFFFYYMITMLAFMTTAEPRLCGKEISSVKLKLLLSGMAVVFAAVTLLEIIFDYFV